MMWAQMQFNVLNLIKNEKKKRKEEGKVKLWSVSNRLDAKTKIEDKSEHTTKNKAKEQIEQL